MFLQHIHTSYISRLWGSSMHQIIINRRYKEGSKSDMIKKEGWSRTI